MSRSARRSSLTVQTFTIAVVLGEVDEVLAGLQKNQQANAWRCAAKGPEQYGTKSNHSQASKAPCRIH